MIRLVARRLLLVIPTLFGLVLLTFIMVRVVPSDPAAALAGENATPAQVQQIRDRYAFDQPLVVQFGAYLQQLAHGDLGTSFYTSRPVAEEILNRLPATLELTVVSLLWATLVGIPLGVLSAEFHNRLVDHLIRIVSVGGLAVASFWLALMLQFVFSMELDVLPLRGRISIIGTPPPQLTGSYLLDSLFAGQFDTFMDALQHIFLPALTLGLGVAALIVRFTRGGVLEIVQQDYVTYATAVGYPRWVIVGKFVLKNALVATITQIGLLFGGVIAGAVVVESIFDWPGVGGYLVQSIFVGDYQATLAATLLVGVIYALVNIVVDIAHGIIDPRIGENL